MACEDFFKLKDTPFRLAPDPDYYFPSDVHKEALQTLIYSINAGEGFVQITGEPGTGKTLLIRTLLRQLDIPVNLALIQNPTLSPNELLRVILDDLGDIDLLESDHIPKEKLLRIFRDMLFAKAKDGQRTIVIVDEAQQLPVETLEELRLLSNLETEKEKLLQIILVGQVELEEKLNLGELKQLAQRITIRYRLLPLSKENTFAYIRHRIEVAGGTVQYFSSRVLDKIYSISGGVPRKINIICERAMMAAFVEGEEIVQKHHLVNALKSIKGNAPRSNRIKKSSWFSSPTMSLCGLLIIGLLTFGYTQKGTETISLLLAGEKTSETEISHTTEIVDKEITTTSPPENPLEKEKHHTESELDKSTQTHNITSRIESDDSKTDISPTLPVEPQPLERTSESTTAEDSTTAPSKETLKPIEELNQIPEPNQLQASTPTLAIENNAPQSGEMVEASPLEEIPAKLNNLPPEVNLKSLELTSYISTQEDNPAILVNLETGKATFSEGTKPDMPNEEKIIDIDWPFGEGIFVLGRDQSNKAFLFSPTIFFLGNNREKAESLLHKLSIPQDRSVIPLVAYSSSSIHPLTDNTSTSGINILVQSWADAWRQKKLDEFLTFYDSAFTAFDLGNSPRVYNSKANSIVRSRVFLKSGDIKLQISDPTIIIDPRSPKLAIAIFHQQYNSATFADKGNKVLYLRLTQSENTTEWKIMAKLWIPNIKS